MFCDRYRYRQIEQNRKENMEHRLVSRQETRLVHQRWRSSLEGGEVKTDNELETKTLSLIMNFFLLLLFINSSLIEVGRVGLLK